MGWLSMKSMWSLRRLSNKDDQWGDLFWVTNNLVNGNFSCILPCLFLYLDVLLKNLLDSAMLMCNLGYNHNCILLVFCRYKSYPWTPWDISSGGSPLYFPLVGLHRILIIFSTFGACSDVVLEYEWRATYFSWLRAKFILAPLGIPNWVSTLNVDCSSSRPP